VLIDLFEQLSPKDRAALKAELKIEPDPKR